jgi:ribonuclease BN (tRNA processing enzyme)
MSIRSACSSIIVICALVFVLAFDARGANQCPAPDGVALQILGSGGPIADDGRASASYLVWVNGKSRVMIDVGGGSFLRFGEAGARFSDLLFVGLSHFHTDHSADFPTLLKTGLFAPPNHGLVLAGPDAGGPFPGLSTYVDALLNPESGAYGYLSGYLDGSRGLPKMEMHEIPVSSEEASVVFHDVANEITVEARGVPHGIVPALGFKVRIGNAEIVFASDQNGSDPRFAKFAAGADVLVMHMPIPEGTTDSALQLHAPPDVIGSIADKAQVDTLVLSHFMARSLRNLEHNVAVVKSNFGGRTIVAEDLDCLIISQTD